MRAVSAPVGQENAGAAALTAVLIAGILVAWAPGFWATSVLHIGLSAIAAAYLLVGLREPNRWTGSWLCLPLAVAALMGPLQMATHVTVYPYDTGLATLNWLSDFLAFVLAARFLRPRAVRERFLDVILYFGFVLVVVAIIQSFTAPRQVFWMFDSPFQVIGPFVYKNQFAAFVELLLPIALYRMLTRKGGALLFGFMSATMFAAVVMSASRVGVVLLAVEILLVLIAAWGRRMVTNRVALLLFGQMFVLLGICTAVVGWEALGEHFQDHVSGTIRQYLLNSSLQMMRDRPLLGWGLGTWRIVYPAYALFDNGLFANAAHSDWAQWTAEGGGVFALCMAAVFVRSAVLSWRWLWGCGVFFVFVHSFFDYPSREPVIGVFLFVMLGGMAAAHGDGANTHERDRKRRRSTSRDVSVPGVTQT